MFHVEVNLIYISYLVNLVFLMRPSGDQPDVPRGPRGEKFANPCTVFRALPRVLNVLRVVSSAGSTKLRW